MTTLFRKEYKGTANKDENLKLLCDIRHQYTNYDKLAMFYSVYPEKRSALNGVIAELIKTGPDGIDKFRKRVKVIEEYVDLNRKEAKQRFLNDKIVKLRMENPQYDYALAKKIAETNLASFIRKNNKHIEKLKGVKNDGTRINK